MFSIFEKLNYSWKSEKNNKSPVWCIGKENVVIVKNIHKYLTILSYQ